MSEQPENAFFPVPVRWFEIPMNPVRWGIVRSPDSFGGGRQDSASFEVESNAPLVADTSGQSIGQILDTHA